MLRSLEYWIKHWDWECPTVFGLELSKFQSIVNTWPEALIQNEEIAVLAIFGSFREFLHGASSVRPNQVSNITGINFEHANELLNRLGKAENQG